MITLPHLDLAPPRDAALRETTILPPGEVTRVRWVLPIRDLRWVPPHGLSAPAPPLVIAAYADALVCAWLHDVP